MNVSIWGIKTGTIPPCLHVDINGFQRLWNLHPPTYETINMFGKTGPLPRYQSNYLRSYRFSGKTFQAQPIPDEFKAYYDWALQANNNLTPSRQVGMLVNFYEPQHYIGAHRDSETDLVVGAPILSISLGGPRTFRVRRASDKSRVVDIEMKDGTYMIMGGDMQTHFTHEVIKVTGKTQLLTSRRINMTFRCF